MTITKKKQTTGTLTIHNLEMPRDHKQGLLHAVPGTG